MEVWMEGLGLGWKWRMVAQLRALEGRLMGGRLMRGRLMGGRLMRVDGGEVREEGGARGGGRGGGFIVST